MSQQHILPPIQQLDGQQHPHSMPPQSQHQYPPPVMNGAQMQHHPPPPLSNPYPYPPENMQQPMGMNGAPNGHMPMRFPLPPQGMDARQMSGGRHKKEIKRRTKTGCLTCRRRRIKCDEGHPHCRNCQKSKRECLGYDPIFKSQGNPAPIQPAPGSVPQLRQDSSAGARGPMTYPPAPQGYAPASSAGYAPPVQPHTEPGFDYGVALDPALATGHAPVEPLQQNTYTTTLLPRRIVKRVQIHDLFNLEDIPPSSIPLPDDSRPLSEGDVQEMKAMFKSEYGPGLDRFFETPWYSTHGEHLLQVDHNLAIFIRHCIERFQQPKNQHEEYQVLPSLETQLVWRLACLPRLTSIGTDLQETQDLLRRLDAVESLLTGSILESSRVAPFPAQPPSHPNERYMIASFWHHLATFTSIDDSSADPSVESNINNTLSAMRVILNVLENRDVLYSMAIARHFGGRQAEMHKGSVLIPITSDPEDPIGKLVIAQQFISQEETAGTSQVVQRLCGIARRGWMQQRESVEPIHHSLQLEHMVKQEEAPQHHDHDQHQLNYSEEAPKQEESVLQNQPHEQPQEHAVQQHVAQAIGGADASMTQ